MSASETHNRKNTNKSIADSLKPSPRSCRPRARAAWPCAPTSRRCGVARTKATCRRASLGIAQRLLELGCYQVSLGDTIGVGTPLQTSDIVQAF
jgi:hydroxymethylglutaryl-CoA lyase